MTSKYVTIYQRAKLMSIANYPTGDSGLDAAANASASRNVIVQSSSMHAAMESLALISLLKRFPLAIHLRVKRHLILAKPLRKILVCSQIGMTGLTVLQHVMVVRKNGSGQSLIHQHLGVKPVRVLCLKHLLVVQTPVHVRTASGANGLTGETAQSVVARDPAPEPFLKCQMNVASHVMLSLQKKSIAAKASVVLTCSALGQSGQNLVDVVQHAEHR